jgi:hypothetical protein
MGPHAVLADHTVRENIMTGLHFLGCKCCGTYDRHNQVVNVALAYFRPVRLVAEIHRLNQLSRQQLCHCVGTSADGKSKHTDGQVWGSLSWLRRVAFDVSIVNPTAVSHSGAGACAESFLNPNAGTRAALLAEETKTNRYKRLCQAAWYGLCTDRLHNEWGDGRAVPAAILEPTLD